MSGAWSKGASKAVSSAPPAAQSQSGSGGGGRGGGSGRNTTNNNNRRSNNSRGGGGGRRGGQNSEGGGGGRNQRGGGGGGRHGGGGGRGRGGGGGDQPNGHRITVKDVQLLNETGLGNTAAQKKVIRIDARHFIANRLKFIEPCTSFTPHQACHWTSEDRLAEIQALCSKVMELGDVSKGNNAKNKTPINQTAPPLEECTPLEVNEETRWKSNAMRRQSSVVMMAGDAQEMPKPETPEEIVAKARLILNKLSWTTLEKLTAQFMDMTQLATREDVRALCIPMLIEKAHREHHFAPMYAQMCATISKQVKPFKKELLTNCQKEFEVDIDERIAKATENITNPDEKEYESLVIRKDYVGHMKFLGELYLRDVVKLAIMTYCLDQLLKDDEHEDYLECFAHLMTTMGEKLDGHAKQNGKPFHWDRVVEIRNSTKISNRIKFLLQDLLDLKDRGWEHRRKQEKAKTLAEIQKEVAQEEQQKAKMGRRHSTQENIRRSSSVSNVESVVDEDGFVQINKGSMRKVGSKVGMEANANAGPPGTPSKYPAKPEAGAMKRSQSQPTPLSTSLEASPFGSKRVSNKFSTGGVPSMPAPQEQEPKTAVPSPEDCAKKIKTVLKEFFVSGEIDDTVLSVSELVQADKTGSLDRGAKVVEGATLLVMEMKEDDVNKMLAVMTKSVQDGKLEKEAIAIGLNDPLECLSDIEIDAPLARNHLASIVAECIKLNVLQLTFLKEAPEYFRTDGKPAAFAVKVLQKVQAGRDGEAPSEEELSVLGDLMTEDDKTKFDSPKAMFEAA